MYPSRINIMITASAMLKNAVDALNLGANAYILKPIDFARLDQTMKDSLRKQRKTLKTTEERLAEFMKDTMRTQAPEISPKMGAEKDIEKRESKMIHAERDEMSSESKPTGYVATGYADLDGLLYGGLPRNHAVVLTSPSCDERDLLVKSFLETGAKKGEVTFYVTIDVGAAKALAEEFESNFYLFVCNPQADAIIKSSPNLFTLKGVENLTDISIALTSAIRTLDPSLKSQRRICMGLISDVLLQHHAVQTRRWLARLIPELQSEGFTTLAVMDPEMHSSEEVRAVLDLFEGEINIYGEETEEGLGKYLKIKKMSNHKHLENELLLKKGGQI
jgi:KaiC/GvpD/RAD55 family RecA-like ATPase